MKSLEEFTHAGTDLHKSLTTKRVTGTSHEGYEAVFMMNFDGSIDVNPVETPPYGHTMRLDDFIGGFTIALAIRDELQLDRTIFNDEVMLLAQATKVALREQSSRSALNYAVNERHFALTSTNFREGADNADLAFKVVEAEYSLRQTRDVLEGMYKNMQASHEGVKV